MCNYNRLNFKQIALVSGEALPYILFVYIQMLNIFLRFSVSVYCNKYTFSNIAQLITHCIEEKKKGEAGDPDWVKKNPDWNKVVLIPVKVDFDTNNSIIGVSNNLDMESAELKGGTKAGNELKMQIIYTKF